MAYRVFIADSSPSALKALHLAFQDSNYDLYTAQDGGEAIDLIRQIKPDAVVLGLSLPQTDGYEIARRLKAMEDVSQIPIILLRAGYEDLNEERLAELDVDEIVSKPFDSEELAHKIRTLISGTRDPESLPEEPEPVCEERPEGERPPGPTTSGSEPEDAVQRRIKKEVLEMERELEKRVAARVRAEIKAWLQFDLPEDSVKN
jgi:DNA-binding response OmpR family regulator